MNFMSRSWSWLLRSNWRSFWIWIIILCTLSQCIVKYILIRYRLFSLLFIQYHALSSLFIIINDSLSTFSETRREIISIWRFLNRVLQMIRLGIVLGHIISSINLYGILNVCHLKCRVIMLQSHLLSILFRSWRFLNWMRWHIQLLLHIMHVLYLHNLHYSAFLTYRFVIYCWKFILLVILKIYKILRLLFSIYKSWFSIAFRTWITCWDSRICSWILNNIAIFGLFISRMLYLFSIGNIWLGLTCFRQVPWAFIFMNANRFQIGRKKWLTLLKR